MSSVQVESPFFQVRHRPFGTLKTIAPQTFAHVIVKDGSTLSNRTEQGMSPSPE
jgi:hypothetical protein